MAKRKEPEPSPQPLAEQAGYEVSFLQFHQGKDYLDMERLLYTFARRAFWAGYAAAGGALPAQDRLMTIMAPAHSGQSIREVRGPLIPEPEREAPKEADETWASFAASEGIDAGQDSVPQPPDELVQYEHGFVKFLLGRDYGDMERLLYTFARRAFWAGYRAAGGALPEEWRLKAGMAGFHLSHAIREVWGPLIPEPGREAPKT